MAPTYRPDNRRMCRLFRCYPAFREESPLPRHRLHGKNETQQLEKWEVRKDIGRIETPGNMVGVLSYHACLAPG